MMANVGDTLRMCSDITYGGEDYADADLLAYEFNNLSVIVNIVELLNSVYECEKEQMDKFRQMFGFSDKAAKPEFPWINPMQ